MAKKKSSAVAKTPNLVVDKPISFWHRDLKADAVGLFKALGKSVVHIGTGKFWELAGDSTEAISAIGLKSDPEGLTWHLIHQSLQSAMHTLVDEAWSHRPEKAKVPSVELVQGLDDSILETKLEVDSNFFRKPGDLPFLSKAIEWFREWLIWYDFDKQVADSVSQRLRTYFVFALNQQWRDQAQLYAPILAASTTPFTQAGEHELAWEQYRSWLEKELDSPMFGEPFSLRQLYIELRGYAEIHEEVGFGDHIAKSSDQKMRSAFEVTPTLLKWLSENDRSDALRVISGGPGSGKSSLAKKLTLDVLAAERWRAIYIPLHRIKYKGDLVDSIHDYLHRTNLLPGTQPPLEHATSESPLLIVVDGLDELAVLGKIAQNHSMEFVRAIKELVRDKNTTGLCVKVILTGRTVVMQGLQSELSNKNALLNLLPYYVTPDSGSLYKNGWKLLENNDQRQLWWTKYGKLTGKGYDGLPEQLNIPGLTEVSSEPLLNYLLAIANQASTFDFSKGVTENQIYSGLIQEVYDRRWSDGKHFSVEGMSRDDFQRVLEEIAVAAWHGDGRKTTVGEIKQHCEDAGIARMLEVFQDGAENGVLRLLTAFFFRQAGARNDENVFEFTHKSFGEYLVARRMIRLLGDIAEMTELQLTKYRGWDDRVCLQKWAELCGPSPLNSRQLDFLRNEMWFDYAKPHEWQVRLVELINNLLRHAMPMEKLAPQTYQDMRTQSRNAEEALLLVLNACARITRKVSEISWPEHTSAGTWFKLLQGQRSNAENVLAFLGLSYLRLDGQIFDFADLYHSDLTFTSLVRISAHGAALERTDFQGADLQGANLQSADLQIAQLQGANLQSANFQMARLRRANLQGANLQKAILRGANLESADFRNAELEHADLQHAHFNGADLQHANLQHADLQGANFDNAKFFGAKLDGAKLDGAKLDHAIGLPKHLRKRR